MQRIAIYNFWALVLPLCFGIALGFSGSAHPEAVGQELGLATKKPTLVVFGYGDCGSCALQLVNLSEVAGQYPELELKLVAPQRDLATIRLAKAFKYDLEIQEDPDGALVNQLAIQQVPAVVLVDSQNRIQGFYEGILSPDELEQLITPLLAGKPLPLIVAPGGVGDQAAPIPDLDYSSSQANLLIFHSLTCPYCEAEIPELIEFAESNPQYKVWIVPRDKPQEVAGQFTEAPENVTVLPLEDGAPQFEAFYVDGTPTQILVNQKGEIVWRNSGYTEGVFSRVPQPASEP